MSLRIMYHGAGAEPYSWPVSLSATFQAGMFAQLTLQGNGVVAGVSNGSAPIGIIDDVRSKSYSAVSWDEEVIVDAIGVMSGSTLVSSAEIKYELNYPNIFPDSFISIPVSVALIPRNGVVVFPAGTELNFDRTGSGTFNAIRTTVRYNYQIPNILGEDTTAGSNRVTVWFQRGIYQTDVFDTSASYPLNANLFVNAAGMLTTKQPTPNHPSVAIVTSPPSMLFPWAEFLLL